MAISLSNSVDKRIVLQGEIGFATKTNPPYIIKTSCTTACHIVTVYIKEFRFAALAHIDGYTCVEDTIDKIKKIIICECKLKSFDFNDASVSVIGGEQLSIETKTSIIRQLNAKKISVIDNRNRQIEIDAQNGTIAYFKEEDTDPQLEVLQTIEYTNHCDYVEKDNEEIVIPAYQATIATRKESDLTFSKTIQNENIKAFKQIKNCDTSSGVATFNYNEEAKKEVLKLINKKREVSQFNKDMIIGHLKQYIETHCNNADIKEAFYKNDFNLLLRRSAANTKELRLLELLLNVRLSLNIDVNSRGEQSKMSAFDVATKFKNKKAITLLTKYV